MPALRMRRNWNLDEAQEAAAEAQAAVAELEAAALRTRTRAAQEGRRLANLAAEERRVRQAADATLVAAASQLGLLVAGLQHATPETRDELLGLVRTLVTAAGTEE